MDEFHTQYMMKPQRPESRILNEIAAYYHETCEAYDRTVCTGPIVSGEIRPRTSYELARINIHARQTKDDCIQLGMANALMEGDVLEAIRNHN